jgi:hypothetical protein
MMTSVEMTPPSLRANGSRECAPDDRLREAIHGAAKLDCFVAGVLAMTAVFAGLRCRHHLTAAFASFVRLTFK